MSIDLLIHIQSLTEFKRITCEGFLLPSFSFPLVYVSRELYATLCIYIYLCSLQDRDDDIQPDSSEDEDMPEYDEDTKLLIAGTCEYAGKRQELVLK